MATEQLPTQEEMDRMLNNLYRNVPEAERRDYMALEHIWFSGPTVHERFSRPFPDPKAMLPIGLNAKAAYALHTPKGETPIIAERKAQMIYIELAQVSETWKSGLLRTRTLKQYNKMLKTILANPDQSFKFVKDIIIKDEDILKHKATLGETGESYNMDYPDTPVAEVYG